MGAGAQTLSPDLVTSCQSAEILGKILEKRLIMRGESDIMYDNILGKLDY
jgi:hypothetical protein